MKVQAQAEGIGGGGEGGAQSGRGAESPRGQSGGGELMSTQKIRLADTPVTYPQDVEQVEIAMLLEAVYRHYGFDFRSYAYASIKRRIWKRILAEGLSTVSALQERVLHDREVMEHLLLDLSVTVSSMFRDPSFFKAMREEVIPLLRTYPFLRIWHAGCSTGEEVHSMAIMLEEEGLYERCRIYATDINEVVLQRARTGIFPLDKMQEYTQNYQHAGGTRSFSEYYTAGYDGALFNPDLTRNVTWAQHNLVTDGSFAECHVIVCRNVMIYFSRELQERVLGLFHRSLPHLGILALGRKESLRLSEWEQKYEPVNPREKIFRRIA